MEKNPTKPQNPNPGTEDGRKPEKTEHLRFRGESLTDPSHHASRKTSNLLRFDSVLYPGFKKKKKTKQLSCGGSKKKICQPVHPGRERGAICHQKGKQELIP